MKHNDTDFNIQDKLDILERYSKLKFSSQEQVWQLTNFINFTRNFLKIKDPYLHLEPMISPFYEIQAEVRDCKEREDVTKAFDVELLNKVYKSPKIL